MGEGPYADGYKVQKEGADCKAQEILDEGAGVFVEAFHHSVMLNPGDNSKVEWYEWHDGLECARCEPEGAERCQYQYDGQKDEGYVVFLHVFGVLYAVGLPTGGVVLLDEVDGFLGGELFAVVAAEFEVLFVDYVEFGGYGLCIGDAFGVGAFDKVFDVVGDFG